MIGDHSNAQSAAISALLVANYQNGLNTPDLWRCFCVTRERMGLITPYHRHGTLWSAQSQERAWRTAISSY